MKTIILAAAAALSFTVSADAACTKPVGSYAGIGHVYIGDANDNYYSKNRTVSVSFAIRKDGVFSVHEIGKDIGSKAPYETDWTGVMQPYAFNKMTCQGSFTDSKGAQWNYTSTNSGNVLTISMMTSDGIWSMFPIRMEKL